MATLLGNDFCFRSEVAQLARLVLSGFVSMLPDEVHRLLQGIDCDILKRRPAKPVIRVPMGNIQPFDRLPQAVRVSHELHRIRSEELRVDQDEHVLAFDDMGSVCDVVLGEGGNKRVECDIADRPLGDDGFWYGCRHEKLAI